MSLGPADAVQNHNYHRATTVTDPGGTPVRASEVGRARDVEGPRDVFEGRERPETPAPQGEEKEKGFFGKIFAAIGNFFKSIWNFLTGGGEKEDSAGAQREAGAPAANDVGETAERYAREQARRDTVSRDPRSTLRPGTQTSTRRAGPAHRSSPHSPTTNSSEVMAYLIDHKGISRAGAAAIASNIAHESSFDPNAAGDKNDEGVYTAYGLAQWREDRLAELRDDAGTDTPNAAQQLDFLVKELHRDYETLGQLIANADNMSVEDIRNQLLNTYPRRLEGQLPTGDDATPASVLAMAFQKIYERPKYTDAARGVTADRFVASLSRRVSPGTV